MGYVKQTKLSKGTDCTARKIAAVHRNALVLEMMLLWERLGQSVQNEEYV